MIDYSKFPQKSPRKRNNIPKFYLLLPIIIAILYVFVLIPFKNSRQASNFISPLASGIIEKGVEFLNPEENSLSLEKIVQNELANAKGDYAVTIKNLKTGERYYFNEHKVFDAASLYKLFVMATVFQKVENGKLTKEQVLSQKIPVLNQKFRISSESAELKEGSITLPVQSALSRMITISDNYSALLLAENAKLSNVSLFLKNNKFLESRVGTKGETPATTASDITSFFEKLYEGKLASAELTADMLKLLKSQKLNSKIPKYLPKDVVTAHKTGELGRLSHDAGIIYSQKGDYIMVVLSDTSKPVDTNEEIALISKAVHEYFTN